MKMRVSLRNSILAALLLAMPVYATRQQPGPSVQSGQAGPGSPQKQSPPSQPPGGAIRIGADEVLLDLIVRDKKGRPIRDLRPEEIEIYDDNVRQSIVSLRMMDAASEAAGGASAAGRSGAGASAYIETDPARQINLVTMVFDNLDANGRRLARDAALDFIANGMRSNVLIAVFVVDNRFFVLQPFTNNREKLKQAIEAATGRSERQFTEISKQITTQLEIIANAADFGPPASAPAQAQAAAQAGNARPSGMQSLGLTPTGAGQGGTGVDKAMAQITLSTLRAIESAQLDQRARASIHAFMHIAREQRRLAGRKTVLYFSNGLQVPSNLVDVLRTTLSEANRSNVSIYAIDSRGLNMEIESQASRAQLAMAIEASRASTTSNDRMDRSALMSADFAENSLRMSKQGTLAELAEGTGGFLVTNTNDLRTPLRRVAMELSSYYALSYVPAAREPDGRFHSITVKVSRPEVQVQSRSGYYAAPAVDGRPVMAYEMPMLAAVNLSSPPRDFPHRVSVTRFAPRGENGAQHLLQIEIPLSGVTFKTDPVKKQYSTHLSLLALVRNEKGEVVNRVSQDYPILGRLERLESLKRGNLDFSQSFDLSPGRYTIETVAHDVDAGRISVERQGLTAPEAGKGLALSSLIPIRRIEATGPSGMARPSDERPLLTPQGRIVPHSEDRIDLERENSLSFYLVAYLPEGEKQSPPLTLEFLQGGQVVSRGSMPLPPPDERGRVYHILSIPSRGLRSGEYEIRATLKLGAMIAEEKRSFTLINPRFVETAEAPALQAAAPAAPAVPTAAPAIETPAVPMITPEGISPAVLAASAPIAQRAAAEVRAAAINIPDFLAEVGRNGIALHRHLLNFTYQHRKVLHVLDDLGRPTQEEFTDYEAYPVRGRHVLIKTAIRGKALPAWEIESERKRAGEELMHAESDATGRGEVGYVTAGVSGSHRGKAAGFVVDPAAFLRACDFFDPRIDTLQGREMIVLDFTPRLGADLPVTKSFVSKLAGTIWIDAIDKVIVRIEARNLLPGLDKNGKPLPVSPHPKLVYQQTRQPSGDWFPQVIRVNTAGDPSAFYGLHWDVVFEFKDYRQFNTTGEETRILSPEKKP